MNTRCQYCQTRSGSLIQVDDAVYLCLACLKDNRMHPSTEGKIPRLSIKQQLKLKQLEKEVVNAVNIINI